ncbi:MAG: hypothetical protein PHU23_17320 [Dehalococcoidales bacterium]|nr:hypothetical protein [Dehalococcoidales bacterium]
MNNQPPLNWMGLLLLAALLRMGYELSQMVPAGKESMGKLLTAGIGADQPEAKWQGLQPWQRKASEKAVENYAAVQDRKWRRWNEAMFERLR